MGHILCLASASAAITTALSLLAGFGPAPAVPAGPPPQALTVAAPARAIRVIPIDGRHGAADLPILH